MRRLALVPLLAAGILACLPFAGADSFSKTYQFKEGTTLELGTRTDDGLRLDNVRFRLPAAVEGRSSRTSGLAGALVAVSNVGEESLKVGIAIALLDSEGRLVGVASGGTALLPLKSGRQKTYTLIFENVNERIHQAATFQITLESR